MMLLHDGVELPCVLETAYTIEDIEPYRAGADGLWVFARSSPALLSRLVLGHPAGTVALWGGLDRAPEPRRGRDEAAGLETLTFEMGPIGPVPQPPTPTDAGPRVAWSTHIGWGSLGDVLLQRFDDAAVTNDELEARFDEHLEAARTEAEKADLAAEFVAQTTRAVEYETGWWPAPRDAARTWSTAYGDTLDRAVLAAALYRRAGLEATPAFYGRAPGEVDPRVAGLAWAEGLGLWIAGEGVEGWFDPRTAAWSYGMRPYQGYAVWRLGRDSQPLLLRGVRPPDRISLRLDLGYDAGESKWTGTAVLDNTGVFCPFDRMSGLGSEALVHLRQVAEEVLPGAEVGGYNPEKFNRYRVTVGFEIGVSSGEPDSRGRLRLEAAAPAAFTGLFERAAVRLHDETRESAVRLPKAIEARVELHLDPGSLKPVYLPAPHSIENVAGRFELESSAGENEITLIRTLALAKDDYAPEEWPDLRALLLAFGSQASRLLLLK
jgi:hypothetical protein